MFFSVYRTIFIHIPKTGGSSLEFAICKKHLPESSNLDTDSYKLFTIRGAMDGIQKYTALGHSHSYISEYYKFLQANSYLKFTVLRNPFDQVTSLYNQMKILMKIPSLEHFILSDEKNSFKNLNHYINQYEYTHFNGELAIDKVFVYDRYHEAQDFVEKQFDLKIDRDKKLWATTYTGEVWSKEMKDRFTSVHHKSIDLYHRFLKQ
jgi:hypothetical protein